LFTNACGINYLAAFADNLRNIYFNIGVALNDGVKGRVKRFDHP
jgi:hypothetical protein